MPDAIDHYLDQVMRRANLAHADARRVRAELKEHLCEMTEHLNIDPSNQPEALAMVSKEFGDPNRLGTSIARSQGRFTTWLKKKARRLPIVIGVGLVLILTVRATVAEAFKVGGDGVRPILLKGNRCLVYKLASSFSPDDIVVYKPADHPELRYLGIVREMDQASGDLKVSHDNHELMVPRRSIVGKVFLSTR